MKMGKSKFRRLEEMGLRTMSKPRLTDNPTNRAERRALAKANKRKKPQKDSA